QASRVHRVDFRGYSWLRYAASESTKLKMDVYSAAEGVPDGLLLAGDSIANMQCVGLPQSWFATGVAQRAPGRFPPMVGGGIAFTTAVNGRDLLVTGKGDFTKEMGGPILELLQGLPWLGLTFGTNDAAPEHQRGGVPQGLRGHHPRRAGTGDAGGRRDGHPHPPSQRGASGSIPGR